MLNVSGGRPIDVLAIGRYLFLPFLGTGVMRAVFQLAGILPVSIHWLYNTAKGSDRALAQCLSINGENPSGPGDLDTFNLENSLSTVVVGIFIG